MEIPGIGAAVYHVSMVTKSTRIALVALPIGTRVLLYEDDDSGAFTEQREVFALRVRVTGEETVTEALTANSWVDVETDGYRYGWHLSRTGKR